MSGLLSQAQATQTDLRCNDRHNRSLSSPFQPLDHPPGSTSGQKTSLPSLAKGRSTPNLHQSTLECKRMILTFHLSLLSSRLSSLKRKTSRYGRPSYDLSQTSQMALPQMTPPQTTPPQTESFPNTYLSTPFTHTSASYQDSKQTRIRLTEPLLRELSGPVTHNTPCFFAKYFGETAWAAESDANYRRITSEHSGDLLRDWPQKYVGDEVWT